MATKVITAIFMAAVSVGFVLPYTATAQATEINSQAEYAFVTDFMSGKVLMEKQADAPMKPASMAKIMTIYIAFQRIKDG
ncbi:MAG: D-alanyl-D-alanine carboxypeptidase, partial [Bacteroidetes bacterium]|nr:D-alanyl-D-alanine carboxypeptidase [Bacteroidota bacterium]